ncbi:hypothetical protein LCGC14_2007090 [marine sediment metagenome]|uniref:Uncharacterized protein n=1 Tax=marine sediment metagenome TaxID=412755 RepID=A0A0F9HES7_9ZZZZ
MKKQKCERCGSPIFIAAWIDGKKVCKKCFNRLKWEKKSTLRLTSKKAKR